MDSKSLGADLSFAWFSNEVAVMGAEGAASIILTRVFVILGCFALADVEASHH
jgi:acetyl-CoA carboxylase carboxyltransferase component